MAERYDSFYGKEPNIDVNLFVNALTQGIAAGNAQKTTFGAIAGGITDAIKGGVSTAIGVQQIRKNEADLEVSEDPVVIQARKDKEVADAEIAQAEAKAKQSQDAADGLAKKRKAEVVIAESEQKIEDMTNTDEVEGVLKNPSSTAEQIIDVFKKAGSTFNRNPELGLQSVAAAQGRVDKTVLDDFTKVFNAAAQERASVSLNQSRENALQQQAIKQKDNIDQATATLQALSPAIKNQMSNTGEYDPTKLDIVPAGSVEMDKSDKNNPRVKFDAEGRPVIAATSNPDDKRYYATYNGRVIDTFDELRGKDAAKSMADYRLGSSAIIGNTNMSPTKEAPPGPVDFQNSGLAKDVQRIDSQLEAASPQGAPKALGPSAEVLEGKTPQEQNQITERFNQRLGVLENVPRQDREVVHIVNSNPLTKDQKPLVKAIVSVESAGNPDAKSPTNVQGIAQMTQATFDYLKEKHPTLLKDATNQSPSGQLLASKVYMIDLLNQFNDLPIALAAYNAGPGAMAKAVGVTQGSKTWQSVKPNLKQFVSEAKWKEVENYPERVLKFLSYYNG